MLGRLQIFLELDDEMEDADDLTEIISNSHMNTNFLALAREVWLFFVSSQLSHFTFDIST